MQQNSLITKFCILVFNQSSMLAKSFSIWQSTVKVRKLACSGGQHLNLILLATFGTYYGDNKSLTLSTKRMRRTFLSRHTQFPSFGANMLAPKPNDLSKQRWISTCRNVHLLPWRKPIPSYTLHEGIWFFLPPQKGLPDLWSQESCLDHSQLWKPTHLGACCHAPVALIPFARYWATWNAFPTELCMQLQNKEHDGLLTSWFK